MGSLEKLADKVANGGTSTVTVWSRLDGEIVVVNEDNSGQPIDRWSGSIGAWQAAILVALSAKFVEGTLVIETPKLVSHGAMMETLVTAKKIEEETKRTVVVLGPGWRSMSREEAEQALRALTPTEHYPQLTDWVRAQPGGTFLLVVCSADEPVASFASADAHKKVVTMIHEADLSPVSFGYGDDYQAVWLSRHVSPNCESKIPRGVKVYRER